MAFGRPSAVSTLLAIESSFSFVCVCVFFFFTVQSHTEINNVIPVID